MPRFAALLRGVNVGKGNRVPMASLRALLEDLGYSDVATLLNSGNAVFTSGGRSSAPHEPKIRAALKASVGIDVAVIVKSGAELLAAQKENPIRVQEAEASRLLVGFASNPASLVALKDLMALAKAPERMHVGRHALFLWCPNGVSESDVGKLLIGRRGREITTRNWATVSKLIALVEPR
jgi:uncharacterized protein (DUF1697 family)